MGREINPGPAVAIGRDKYVLGQFYAAHAKSVTDRQYTAATQGDAQHLDDQGRINFLADPHYQGHAPDDSVDFRLDGKQADARGGVFELGQVSRETDEGVHEIHRVYALDPLDADACHHGFSVDRIAAWPRGGRLTEHRSC